MLPGCLIRYLVERAVQFQTFGCCDEIRYADIGGQVRPALIPVGGEVNARFCWQFIEEELHRRVQHAGNGEKAACADPVRPFFIFLNLLEGEAEEPPEAFLTHSQFHTPQPHT